MARSATAHRGLTQALGGARVLREAAAGYEALRGRLREGLPYASLEALAARFEIAQDDLAAVLQVPRRTLARRKRARRLRPDESDRLFRIGRIGALAEEVLGAREKAARWLHQPNRAVGGQVPLRHLDTDLGAREVEAVLLRIAHGVHS